MGVAIYRISLTEEERQVLIKITQKDTEKQSVVKRARIILMSDEGIMNQKINEYMRVKEQMVILSEDDNTFEEQYAEMISDIQKMGVKELELYLVKKLVEIR